MITILTVYFVIYLHEFEGIIGDVAKELDIRPGKNNRHNEVKMATTQTEEYFSLTRL